MISNRDIPVRGEIKMIDMHNHILFGTDDGPETIEESVRMVEAAVEAGFDRLMLTPHYFPNGPYLKTAAENQEKFDLLSKVVERAGIQATLYLGNEIMYAYQVPDLICSSDFKSLGNTCYFLLETQRRGATAEGLLGVVRKLENMGFYSIFAHPERVDFVQEEPEILNDFIRRGCLIQCNYLSLTDYYGPMPEKTMKELLKMKLVHTLGSDAHQKEAYELWDQAQESGRTAAGEEYWKQITVDNPEKILSGEKLVPEAGPVSMTVSSYLGKTDLNIIFN